MYNKNDHLAKWPIFVRYSMSSFAYMRGDQKVRGKVLFFQNAFIDCNENSQIETTIHSKLTEIKI